MRAKLATHGLTAQFLFLIALGFLCLAAGCEDSGGDGNCILETAYLCVDEGCYCADDSQWQNPLTEMQAEEECGGCRPPASNNDTPDASMSFQYDRFGGIDDFSGDNDWGTGPQ